MQQVEVTKRYLEIHSWTFWMSLLTGILLGSPHFGPQWWWTDDSPRPAAPLHITGYVELVSEKNKESDIFLIVWLDFIF